MSLACQVFIFMKRASTSPMKTLFSSSPPACAYWKRSFTETSEERCCTLSKRCFSSKKCSCTMPACASSLAFLPTRCVQECHVPHQSMEEINETLPWLHQEPRSLHECSLPAVADSPVQLVFSNLFYLQTGAKYTYDDSGYTRCPLISQQDWGQSPQACARRSLDAYACLNTRSLRRERQPLPQKITIHLFLIVITWSIPATESVKRNRPRQLLSHKTHFVIPRSHKKQQTRVPHGRALTARILQACPYHDHLNISMPYDVSIEPT